MSCAICNTRKPKRACPAKSALICTLCCATGREDTIDCPLACDFLRMAHRHERPDVQFDIERSPNRDIRITDAFIEQYQVPLALLATALADAAMATGKVTDLDAREALEEIIQKYRAITDVSSTNPNATSLREGIEKGITVFRKLESEVTGEAVTDNETIVKMLVFLQRLEFANNNNRRLSRAFLDFIHGFRMPMPAAAAQ